MTSIYFPCSKFPNSKPQSSTTTQANPPNNDRNIIKKRDPSIPTMSDIMESSKSQSLHLELHTIGPFFRVRARSLGGPGSMELGRAEGVIRSWAGTRILHLDSIRLRRETLGMKRSIFGLGLFIGAVAVRHGFDCGCTRSELLAIYDSSLYHSKLVRFYKRMGFEVVREIDGSSMEDLAHMLVWGGKGTRMDADIQQLLLRWGSRFKYQN
ncbi:hypothetical protein QJS04_geneDACA001708 [Acorus gramineus]|uniref:Uncharacterized protein n=1 Tax=Acorus gramineus TaxID=55184 RepID=A0AAV9BH16_ACOGR|nr:hypothetical protein QJS04_geneDACA001708 [Acorus gramineus]